MEDQQSNSSLKTIIAVLAVLLVGSLIYIYQVSTEVETVQKVLTKTVSEKETITKDLEALKLTYDAAIESAGNEKSALTEELTQERDKVIALMAEVNKSKGDVSKYKNQFLSLQTKMNQLMAENEQLKVINTKVTAQRDSTAVVLTDTRKKNEVKVTELVTKNDELARVVEKGSKLTVLNLKGVALQVKKSNLFRSKDKEVETDKASRADVLKISFTIAENLIANSGEKTYYVQVIDGKNNVIGNKEETEFGGKALSYSFITKVKYENKTVKVEESLPGKGFEKGTYFVNIFDQAVLVSTSSFDLR